MAISYNELYLNIRRALVAAGVEAAQLEAREILCSASRKTTAELLRDLSIYTTDEIEAAAMQLLERRQKGEPLAYVLGEWSFMGMSFRITPDVLIPRPETEILADLAVRRLKEHAGPTRLLDLCSGSGCIGIAAASRVPNSHAVLVDLSPAAVDLSRTNIRLCKMTRQVVSMQGDAMAAPSSTLGKFDVIVSNPPYIPSGDIPGLDASVRDFEPHMALDGGEDGLDFYRFVVEEWKSILRPGGHLMFEVGINQSKQVAMLMLKAGYESIRITRDQAGIDRVVEGVRPEEPRKTIIEKGEPENG